ncbi:MAG: LPP20 family lipoprotein [Thiomicrorhabdus sp.]|nr:LPP20 family lipoprotein [Thiomicrorhabdus sp.]
MNNNRFQTTAHFKSLALVIASTALFLTGCQQSKPIAQSMTQPTEIIPAWFISPPKDNAVTLFGLGEGKTKADAIQSALSNLAGKLGTEIQANEKLIKTQYTSAYRYNEEINQHIIESTIHKITLNQYQVVELKHFGYQQFLALVSSNKLLLSRSLQQTLDQQIREYETEKLSLSSTTAFSHFQFFAKQQQSLAEFNNNLSALLTLKKTSKIQPYQTYLHDVQSNFAKAQQQTVFYINHQPTAKHIQKAISDKLLQAGFKTTQDVSAATNTIEIITSTKQTQAYEFFIIREHIELKTTEGNIPSGGNQFALKGQGLNLQQAQQQLALNFKSQLQNSTLETALGINQD